MMNVMKTLRLLRLRSESDKTARKFIKAVMEDDDKREEYKNQLHDIVEEMHKLKES